MRLLVDTAIVRGQSRPDKPNEDFLLVDEAAAVYIVCDGVTRTAKEGEYPVPSPSTIGSERAAKRAMAHLLERERCADPKRALLEALYNANVEVGELNRCSYPEVDFLVNDLVGVVIAIGFICDHTLHFGYIGDCSVSVLRQGRLKRLTRPQTEAISRHRQLYGVAPGSTVEIRRDYRNRIGHKFGYGCLTGDPGAQDFFAVGHFCLQAQDVILIASDGLEGALDLPGSEIQTAPASVVVERATLVDRLYGRKSDDKALVRIVVMGEHEATPTGVA